jgi:hypothetical protein
MPRKAKAKIMPEKRKRNMRSHSEIREDLTKRIDYHKNAIVNLEQKIADLDKPRVRKFQLTEKGKTKKVLERAVAAGKTPEEIAAALGLDLEDWE